MADITISKERLYLLTVSALRYAMGRQTYIVGETVRFIRDYWKHLDIGMREVVIRDLTQELEMASRLNRKLGADFDHQEWVNLLSDLTARLQEGLRAES